MSEVKWYGEQVTIQVKTLAGNRVLAAGIHLKNRIRESLSRSQPTAGAGTGKRGLSPSAPGEYPKLVSGFLRRNVSHEFDRGTATCRVGTNVPYGRFLELGTSRMAPRPWLSNAVRDFGGEVATVIQSGTVPGGIGTGGNSAGGGSGGTPGNVAAGPP